MLIFSILNFYKQPFKLLRMWLLILRQCFKLITHCFYFLKIRMKLRTDRQQGLWVTRSWHFRNTWNCETENSLFEFVESVKYTA